MTNSEIVSVLRMRPKEIRESFLVQYSGVEDEYEEAKQEAIKRLESDDCFEGKLEGLIVDCESSGFRDTGDVYRRILELFKNREVLVG